MWNTPTNQRLAQIPKLYETDGVKIENKLIYLHFFVADCDWYVAEFDETDTFFGFVILNGNMLDAEWGNFSFSELQHLQIIGRMEVACELERHWKIRPALQVEKICQVYGWTLELA